MACRGHECDYSPQADRGAAGPSSVRPAGTGGSGGICNVIAGLAHDHLFVQWDQGARALALLRGL